MLILVDMGGIDYFLTDVIFNLIIIIDQILFLDPDLPPFARGKLDQYKCPFIDQNRNITLDFQVKSKIRYLTRESNIDL